MNGIINNAIADVLQLTLSTAVAKTFVPVGARIVVIPSVAAAIKFGGNEATVSLTPQVSALGTLTSSGALGNNETVTINGIVYTFKTALTASGATPYEVLIGANQTASHLNLQSAINDLPSGRASTFGRGTVEHPDVWGSSATGTTTVVTAKRAGTVGNLITTTEVCANAAWGAGTLASGAGERGQIILPAGALFGCKVPATNPWVSDGRLVTSIAAIAGGAGTLQVIVFA